MLYCLKVRFLITRGEVNIRPLDEALLGDNFIFKSHNQSYFFIFPIQELMYIILKFTQGTDRNSPENFQRLFSVQREAKKIAAKRTGHRRATTFNAEHQSG